jgi:hypothetical protein
MSKQQENETDKIDESAGLPKGTEGAETQNNTQNSGAEGAD